MRIFGEARSHYVRARILQNIRRQTSSVPERARLKRQIKAEKVLYQKACGG